MTLTVAMVEDAVKRCRKVPQRQLYLYIHYGIRPKRGTRVRHVHDDKVGEGTVTFCYGGNHVCIRTDSGQKWRDHAYSWHWPEEAKVLQWERVACDTVVWWGRPIEEGLRAARPFYDANPDSRTLCHYSGMRAGQCGDDGCAICAIKRQREPSAAVEVTPDED